MKKIILAIATILAVSISTQAQYNKDASPDMRYTVNKQVYGSTYEQSTKSRRNSGTYSTLTPTYPSSKVETYTTPNNSFYSQPRLERQSTIPSYPTTKNGTPDMRYKENKQLYGIPKF